MLGGQEGGEQDRKIMELCEVFFFFGGGQMRNFLRHLREESKEGVDQDESKRNTYGKGMR